MYKCTLEAATDILIRYAETICHVMIDELKRAQ